NLHFEMTFPSPMGGVPYHIDLAPSVIFTVAYGCLVPFIVYRVWDKNSRTLILLGTIIFAISRIVSLALRAVQSVSESKRFSLGLTSYIQADIALGYIGIAADLANILRTLLIMPTYGSDTYFQSTDTESHNRFWLTTAKLADAEAGGSSSGSGREFPGRPPAGTPDHPRTRFWVRRGTRFTGLAFLASSITGGTAAGKFQKTVEGEVSLQYIVTLRYVSTAIALFLTLWIVGGSLWGLFFLPRIKQRGCLILCSISVLMVIIAIYRLCLMHNTMDSIQSTGPGSFSTPKDKALFYVFHILPEWISTALLLVLNTKRIFSTGFAGDWRWRDETPEEKEKRLKGEAKHREKLKLRQLHLATPKPAFTNH
ncbi:hypothetical protein AN958_03510, partial [Leucoagaricus sp. SymC.cos]